MFLLAEVSCIAVIVYSTYGTTNAPLPWEASNDINDGHAVQILGPDDHVCITRSSNFLHLSGTAAFSRYETKSNSINCKIVLVYMRGSS